MLFERISVGLSTVDVETAFLIAAMAEEIASNTGILTSLVSICLESVERRWRGGWGGGGGGREVNREG